MEAAEVGGPSEAADVEAGEVMAAELQGEAAGEVESAAAAEVSSAPESGGEVLSASAQAPQGEVASAEGAAQPSGAVLPFTGNAALTAFVIAGLALIGAGTLLIARRH